MKRKKRVTLKEKQARHGTIRAYCESKRKKAAVKLNEELNG